MGTLFRASVLVSSFCAAETVACLDEDGAEVNWWILLKHPANSGGDGSGTQYVYATSKQSSHLLHSSRRVTDEDSLLGRQLEGIYRNHSTNYVFYNDQLPDGRWTLEYGHSKGFFAYDLASGFWVQHSIPRFPNYRTDGYLYGRGQQMFGQHAFCMTLTPGAIDEIARVMELSNGWIYDHRTDSTLPGVEGIVKNGKMLGAAGTIARDVETEWGALRLFGKTTAFDSGMVPELIAPQLRQTMWYQSWLNTGGPLGPYCAPSGFDVFDITSVALPGDDVHPTNIDHSKWAVAQDPASDWFCALDNNHVQSQDQRSGLAVCLQHHALSKLMRGAVAKVDSSCQELATISPVTSPAPPSPADPGPSANKCCFHRDTAGACSAGEICCSESRRSYESEETCNSWGAKHGCMWAGSTCLVGSSVDTFQVLFM